MKFIHIYDEHEIARVFYDMQRIGAGKHKRCLVNMKAIMKFALFIIFDKEHIKIITPNSEIIIEKDDIHVKKNT